MNSSPFKYVSANGTVFEADRCDFANGLNVSNINEDFARFISDVAEAMGNHALNFWPALNGFAGYDVIQFNFAPPAEYSETEI